MPRVIHFDLTARDTGRARTFYSNVFGWKIEPFEGEERYWLITTGDDDEPGINGGLMRRQDTDITAACSVAVDSIDETVGKLEAAGGTVVRPKSVVPGVGYFAYCEDTEGNALGLIQWDRAAR